MAHAVGGAIGARELEQLEERISRKRTGYPLEAAEKDPLPFGRELPLGVKNRRRPQLAIADSDDDTAVTVRCRWIKRQAWSEVNWHRISNSYSSVFLFCTSALALT